MLTIAPFSFEVRAEYSSVGELMRQINYTTTSPSGAIIAHAKVLFRPAAAQAILPTDVCSRARRR